VGTKIGELDVAKEVRQLKRELCALIFDDALSQKLSKLEPEQVCGTCASLDVSKLDADPCDDCDLPKVPACDHLDPISHELFAFDLGAPDSSSEEMTFTSPIGTKLEKRNMDIYTAQQIAMNRAKALHERMAKPEVATQIKAFKAKVKALYRARDMRHGTDYDDVRRIKLIVVGASVTGVTFHATLYQLMKTNPRGLKFSDIFAIKFIDVYLRPLERLMQARDRTVVPRYEYERLLDTPLDELMEKKRHRSGDSSFLEKPTYWPLRSKSAQDAWKNTHPEMPKELRWGPGHVRSVAEQISKGHQLWMKRYGPKPPANMEYSKTPYRSLMDHLGHWFVGIEEPVRTDDRRGQELDVRFFGVNMNVYGNLPTSHSESDRQDRERAEVGGDVLLRATGLGVDIAGDLPEEITLRKAPRCMCSKRKSNIYDFPSEQRSYWDPIKPELDIQEEQSKHILVVGNSDAAAGVVFSTLLTHFDSCTFEVLAEMFWKCDDETGGLTELQLWFNRLQRSVVALRETEDYKNLSTTDAWTRALHSDDLFHALTDSGYLRPGNNRFLADHVRSGRSIYLGIREEKDHDAAMEALSRNYGGSATDDVKRGIQPVQRYVLSRFLEKAWPENRLLGIVLRNWVNVLLLDFERDGERPLEIERLPKRKKKTYKLAGRVKEFGFGGAVPRDEKRLAEELKYVVNCGGRAYFQHSGNNVLDSGLTDTDDVSTAV